MTNITDINELDAQQRRMLEVYAHHIYEYPELSTVEDEFMGTYKTKAEWAESYLNECGFFHNVDPMLETYFNFNAYAHDAQHGGDIVFAVEPDGIWVFNLQ